MKTTGVMLKDVLKRLETKQKERDKDGEPRPIMSAPVKLLTVEDTGLCLRALGNLFRCRSSLKDLTGPALYNVSQFDKLKHEEHNHPNPARVISVVRFAPIM